MGVTFINSDFQVIIEMKIIHRSFLVDQNKRVPQTQTRYRNRETFSPYFIRIGGGSLSIIITTTDNTRSHQ